MITGDALSRVHRGTSIGRMWDAAVAQGRPPDYCLNPRSPWPRHIAPGAAAFLRHGVL